MIGVATAPALRSRNTTSSEGEPSKRTSSRDTSSPLAGSRQTVVIRCRPSGSTARLEILL